MPDGIYTGGKWKPLPQNTNYLRKKNPVNIGRILGTATGLVTAAAIAIFATRQRRAQNG